MKTVKVQILDKNNYRGYYNKLQNCFYRIIKQFIVL